MSVNNRVDDPAQAGVDHYVGLEHLDTKSLKIRRWGQPDDVSATKLLFEPGDVIFGRRRAYQRKLGVAEFRGIASAHSLVLRARGEVVLPDFLPFFVMSDLFMNRAQEISVGSLSPTINWKTLAAQRFPLPSLPAQRRLLERFRVAHDANSALSETVIALRAVRDACTQEWATAGVQELEADGSVPITRLPPKWAQMTLSQLCASEKCTLGIGPFGSDLVASDYAHESGVPVVFVADVVRHQFKYTSERFVTEEKASQLAAHHACPGDVLVTKMGWPPGEACVVPTSFERGIVTADVIRIRPDPLLVHPHYLAAILNSHWGAQQIVRISPGTTRPKTTLRDFSRIKVNLPPLEEQAEREVFLGDLQGRIEDFEERVATSRVLLKTMIEEALRGS